MIGFGGKSIRKLIATLRRNQLGNQQGIQKGGQKPVDNSHSHSKQQSQNGAAGALGSAFGGAVPQEPNIMNNKFASQGAQQLGTNLWQGEQLASQTAQQRSTPTPIPGEEYLSGGRPDQDISPLMQQQKGKTQTVQNDPKLQEGSDASYGISGYVNTEKEYKQALQEKNHPNVYNSPVKQTPYPHNNKYVYKPGDLMDESDQEESQFKSSNNPDKLISGKTYNVENVSDVQEDKKGQFMTTLDEGEHYGMEKRPTSSKVTNYDQGRNAVRDTLRPAQGNKFKSLWKKK